MVVKIKKKLFKWKGKFVSMPGRVTLTKFVLSSMPLFLMFIFKMPHFVIEGGNKVRETVSIGIGV